MNTKPEPRFPPVTGLSLTDRTLSLPEDFAQPLNLVFVAFQRNQQSDVDTWVPVGESIESEFSDVRYYEVPVLSRLYRPVRRFIDGGMRSAIDDRETRDRTVTVYTSKRTVKRALDIDTEDDIHVLLVDPAGTIHWRNEGPRTEDAEAQLREVLEARS